VIRVDNSEPRYDFDPDGTAPGRPVSIKLSADLFVPDPLAAIPEPSTWALFATAIVPLGLWTSRRHAATEKKGRKAVASDSADRRWGHLWVWALRDARPRHGWVIDWHRPSLVLNMS
jgi:hypothetical protein